MYQSSNRNSLDSYAMWFIVKDWSKIINKDSSIPSINSVKPINDLQEIETEASLDYLDVPSFVKRQID